MPNKTNLEIESDQILTETTTIPEDITAFYDKIDKEDEDEEDQELKTVSFEVNQVHTYVYIYIYMFIIYNIFSFVTFIYIKYNIRYLYFKTALLWRKGKN